MSHVKKKHGSENLFQAGILEGFLSEEESDLGQNTFHNSTGKKKDHLSIKPCLGMLALSHSLGLSSYLLKVSCSLQPSHGLKGKTTSYKTEKMSRF